MLSEEEEEEEEEPESDDFDSLLPPSEDFLPPLELPRA